MPCDTISRTELERLRRLEALKALERGLKARAMTIKTVNGRPTIEGWGQRGDWKDVCVLRQLLHSQDFEVRRIAANAVPREVQIKLLGHAH